MVVILRSMSSSHYNESIVQRCLKTMERELGNTDLPHLLEGLWKYLQAVIKMKVALQTNGSWK